MGIKMRSSVGWMENKKIKDEGEQQKMHHEITIVDGKIRHGHTQCHPNVRRRRMRQQKYIKNKQNNETSLLSGRKMVKISQQILGFIPD